MINKKFITITAAIAGTTIIGGGLYLYKKYKDKINQQTESDDDFCECPAPENGSEEVIDSVVFDDDVADTASDTQTIVDDLLTLIEYFTSNGISNTIIRDAYVTIQRINRMMPEKYSEVKSRIYTLVSSEFSDGAVHDFIRDIKELIYGAIDPCDFFVQNGFKVLALGADCQDDMMKLAGAIMDMMDTDKDRAINVMNRMYDIFESLDVSTITPETYETEFKSYVDMYVNPEITTEESVDESTDLEGTTNTVEEGVENV